MTDSQQHQASPQSRSAEADWFTSPVQGDEAAAMSRTRGMPQATQFVTPLGETHVAMFNSPDIEMSSPLPETTQYESSVGLTGDSQSTSVALRGAKRGYDEYFDPNDAPQADEDLGESQQTEKSFVSTLSMRHSLQRREAYYEMLHGSGDCGWTGFGLLSTDGGHSAMERKL